MTGPMFPSSRAAREGGPGSSAKHGGCGCVVICGSSGGDGCDGCGYVVVVVVVVVMAVDMWW